MACILYKPTDGLTVQGANAFACDLYRELAFKMNAPDYELKVEKREEETKSGRPCVTTGGKCLIVTLNAVNLHVKDKPQWIEFIRSTACGEEVRIPRNKMPCIDMWRVSERAILYGTPPKIVPKTRKIFTVSGIKLKFWEFR